MEFQYTPQRQKNIYSKKTKKPFKLSRLRIDNFLQCQRCFYLDRKHGVDQPPTYPYSLNNAVDALLKKEFDRYRFKGKPHPYLTANKIEAIPFPHVDLESWRNGLQGIQYHHKESNFLVMGAIDDVWINKYGELIIVDYKATCTNSSLMVRNSYKRQMEIYQWLFRKNGFAVSDTGYFVYCNADANLDQFDESLKFEVSLIPYVGNDAWIDDILLDIKECLSKDELPESSPSCDNCSYFNARQEHVSKY